MYILITYSVSIVVILISVFITLYFKSELERVFRESNEVLAFHICNVLIILLISFAAQAVTTIYIFGNELKLLPQLVLLLFIIIPIYMMGYLAFEQYKFMMRKYVKAEDGKVLILNERYLKRK